MFTSSAKVVAGAEGHRNYDVAALTHIRRLTSPSTKLQGAINTLVVGLKTTGIWDKISILCVFSKTTSAESLYDLKGLQDSTTVDSPLFLASLGWVVGSGVGTISLQYSATDSTLLGYNDSHLMCYYNTGVTAGNLMGAGATSATQNTFAYNTGSVSTNNLAYLGDDWVSGRKAVINQAPTIAGFFVGSLLSGTAATRMNTTEVTSTAGSLLGSGETTNDMYVGTMNGAFTSPLSPTARTTAWAMGGGLTTQERADYYTHIQAYMVTMGLEA